MPHKQYVLSIDQGTTSTRAILFDADLRVMAMAQEELPQHYPRPGWVEHDLEDIWRATVAVSRAAMARGGASPKDIAAIGITNQRETTAIWERSTGRPIHRAIVWQDRRTASMCAELKKAGCEAAVTDKSGLLLDPYFSASKIAWLLDNVEGARSAADQGRLAFGTIDSFLLWRLTGGRIHATDATNASRTMLMNIATGEWDRSLLELFNIPASLLPRVCDSADDFGSTIGGIFGKAIAIAGVAGDQQAATVGQACFAPGMLKATYGTGCFVLLNTGGSLIRSENRLLSTIAYQLDGQRTYALEGSIFVAGAAVQWLRDGIGIIESAAQSGELAAQADEAQDVILVPAFVGLGAPYWDAECRGAIFGLTRNSGPKEIARAALESVAFQTRDLTEAMQRDWGEALGETVLRADGAMVASDWTMQRIADILGACVDRPEILETTALGAAWLAGQRVGVYPKIAEFGSLWSSQRRFTPKMKATERERRYQNWQRAVQRTLTR